MRAALALALTGCGADPGYPEEQVGYRDGLADGEPNSGERGTVRISEVLWSGTVTDDGAWDPDDVFVEVRNEGNRPVNLTDWYLLVEGAIENTVRFPHTPFELDVGEHRILAAKTTGCIPEPDWVIPDLVLPLGDPFQITLKDADERLIEVAGSEHMPPFAGGYDLAVSRSMERVELMFGGEGTLPHTWHHYTRTPVDVPNDDRIAEHCRVRTHASPARPNSPDYSGAYSSGSLD